MSHKSIFNWLKGKLNENFGTTNEDLIHYGLNKIGFHVFRQFTIQSDKFTQKHKNRTVDILARFSKTSRIIESDGKVHGDLENLNKTTKERNADFLRMNHGYILINHESINYLRKLIGVEASDQQLTLFLSAYRMLEEYAKDQSGEILTQ